VRLPAFRAGRSFILILTVALALAACTSTSAHDDTSTPPSELINKPVSQFDGFGLDPAQPRPSFVLKDAADADFDFGAKTAGRPTLLFFGYTHCPDECPTTLADIQLALRNVPAAVRTQVLVVFVTTDPARDTGPVIKAWLAQFAQGLSESQFIGLHGTQAQIDAAQAASRITIAEDNGETHSTVVQLYGPDDYAHVSFVLSETERQQMEHDLPIVAAMT
jgi:protein SCO1/2